ncbi:Conodipine-M alpha chain, partial [Paramuricea clavata]
GKRYGISRYQCDLEFKRKMYKICESSKRKRWVWSALGNLFTGKACKATADVYFGAVDNFGAKHYENPSPSWCERSCVQDLLDNYFSLVY